MKYHYTHFQKKKWVLQSAGEDIEKTKFSYVAGRNAKWYRYSQNDMENHQFPHIVEYTLVIYDPAIPSLGYLPK